MLNVHQYLAIRVAHEQDESGRSIARRLHHSQRTVAKAIASETGQPPGYARTKPAALPKLGAFVAAIDAILLADESAPLKQRHTSMQLYRRLVDEHAYRGKYDQVRRYVNKHRRSRRQTLVPLDHSPGERMECDFGQVQVDYPDGRRKTDVLVVTWSFSHAVFLIAVPSQRTESVLHGMVAAFEFFGAVAREVWWDNPKTIATVVLKGRERVLNGNYAALASHYRFDPRACMPAKGQEKPDAESGVKALQRRACTPVPVAEDLAAFNQQLLAFCIAERDRTVTGQTQTIGQRLEIEKPAAIPLPVHRFDPCISQAVAIDKYQTAFFENNRYSVPKWAAFTTATVKAYVDRVEIVSGEGILATHARSGGRGEWVVDPLHYVAALSVRPHALDHSRVFKDWALPAVFGELRARLEREHGLNAGIRQYVRVLQLLSEHPAGRLAEAIGRLWHRQHLRCEYVEEKAHQIAMEQATPITCAPMVKNDSSPARQTDAPGNDAAATEAGAVKSTATAGAPHPLAVSVPRPDLRRFNQLLPSYQSGESHDEHVDPEPAAEFVVAAQPQSPEVADHAGRA
ncbi:MAG: IS21 family transposase [Gemmatimonadaceae bacterium]|nr:IS21 family transposase [Gemmatimonadaceae bacterium]